MKKFLQNKLLVKENIFPKEGVGKAITSSN